jgi:hypothetical protein
MTRRSSKEAGLGALSAFVVARSRRMREGVDGGREERAVEQRRAWARVGGLKEESSVRSVLI